MKILVYLKGFTDDERSSLAQMTALWLASGQIPATILPVLIQEHQVKDGTALEFLMEFFPSLNQQQTEENFAKSFHAKDLPEVVAFRKQVAAANVRSDMIRTLSDAIAD